MKKLTVLLLSALMTLGLAACGGQGGGSRAESTPADDRAASPNEGNESERESVSGSDSESETASQQGEAQEPAGEGGKTLIVYFSATGHTADVASAIAEATGGDLFELVPTEPYSDADLDWTDDGSRVVYEHDNPDARAVELAETTVEDWASYDTVFIGYPIWWGIAAWPVDSFIAANDFTGKTVVPFCTSSSSGLGGSGERLAEAAGSGDWLEGERFQSRASREDVQAWVAGLGL